MVTNQSPQKLSRAIPTILDNANRLLDDAEHLLEFDRPASSFALCILAQEEYAKAFLLYLVSSGALPWSPDTRRFLNDHTCKQLMASIMDFLQPDDIVKWHETRSNEEYRLPASILDAINILRHEKLTRKQEWAWIGDEDPPCDKTVRKIADGVWDKEKQDAIYVRLGKNGDVVSSPDNITSKAAANVLEKTRRLGSLLWNEENDLIPITASIDFKQIFLTFRLLFGMCTIEEYNRGWWNQK